MSDEDEAAEMEDESVAEDVKKKKSSHKLKLARELSDLVTICQSVSYKGFNYAMNKCEWSIQTLIKLCTL